MALREILLPVMQEILHDLRMLAERLVGDAVGVRHDDESPAVPGQGAEDDICVAVRELRKAPLEVHLHLRDGAVLELDEHHAVRLALIEMDAVPAQQILDAVLYTRERIHQYPLNGTLYLVPEVNLAAQEIRQRQACRPDLLNELIDVLCRRAADEEEEAQLLLRQAFLQHEQAPVMYVVILFVLKRWHMAEDLADGFRHGNPLRIELPAIPRDQQDWLAQNLL